MKLYPKLEKFLNACAFCLLSEPDFADIAAAAGVDWKWPKTFAGDAVLEYFSIRDASGREAAMVKMRSVMRLLESQVTNLSEMPADIEGLRSRYHELCKPQAALDTANAILKEPEAYERLIQGFETIESKAVETVDFDGLMESYEKVLSGIKTKGPKVVIPGFESTSELIGGFNPERITLLLAQSGFGKTNLALSLALAAADKMGVGYMNLEMGLADVSSRAAVQCSRKSWKDLYDANISIAEAARKPRFAIRISNGKELHIDNMIAWARAFKRTNPEFGLFIVDYDQKILVSSSRDTPEWKAIHLAIKELEELSKAIGIHVIVVAQFNRQGELASSWRIINSAHTVIKFREHKGGVIIENSTKSRHAKYPCAVYMDYDRAKSRVSEQAPGGVFDLKEEDLTTKQERPSANTFSSMMRNKGYGDT
jgi:hypothetical protein